jgi:hypothetical protein
MGASFRALKGKPRSSGAAHRKLVGLVPGVNPVPHQDGEDGQVKDKMVRPDRGKQEDIKPQQYPDAESYFRR